MDGTALLSYFQRSLSLVLSGAVLQTQPSTVPGQPHGMKMAVSGEYEIALLIDALERVFLFERKSKVFGEPQSWDVFEVLEKEPWALEHTRRIVQAFEVAERGRAFLKVCLKYNWVPDVCRTLSNQVEVMETFYEPSAILRNAESLEIFLQQLMGLDNMIFSIQLATTLTQAANSPIKSKTSVSPASPKAEPSPIPSSPATKKKKKTLNRLISWDEQSGDTMKAERVVKKPKASPTLPPAAAATESQPTAAKPSNLAIAEPSTPPMPESKSEPSATPAPTVGSPPPEEQSAPTPQPTPTKAPPEPVKAVEPAKPVAPAPVSTSTSTAVVAVPPPTSAAAVAVPPKKLSNIDELLSSLPPSSQPKDEVPLSSSPTSDNVVGRMPTAATPTRAGAKKKPKSRVISFGD